MKTLGIIGGIGPESTIQYYRSVIEKYRAKRDNYPTIVINSINLPLVPRTRPKHSGSRLANASGLD